MAVEDESLEWGEEDAALADDGFSAGVKVGLDAAIEWMRVHLSGISAPNESDYLDMREWVATYMKTRA